MWYLIVSIPDLCNLTYFDVFFYLWTSRGKLAISTILPAKSDSDIMFCYKVIRNSESIDHLCINPILRIGLIHKRSIDPRSLKWSVNVNVLLSNCKQNITSLSLLAGRTVMLFMTSVCVNIVINNCRFAEWQSP